jgi:tetratricopeptide (TPR) repeat protein
MSTGADDRRVLEEFDLPEISDILQCEQRGNTARDRGEYETAQEHYLKAIQTADEYVESIHEVREHEDLTPQQEKSLNELENRLELYNSMLDDQIERL